MKMWVCRGKRVGVQRRQGHNLELGTSPNGLGKVFELLLMGGRELLQSGK